jgi:hypothetical protein
MKADEFRRQRRLVSQSLSAHTSLAETYRRRQRALTLGIIILSVVATALAFADEGHHIDIWGVKAALPVWAGVLSTIVFVLALVDLVVGQNRKAGAHEDAARRLDGLAAIYRGISVPKDAVEVDTGPLDLENEYWNVMNSIERIPNRHFVRLKAEHLRKVALSKALDKTPNASLKLLRLTLWRQDNRRLLGGESRKDPAKPETFLPDEGGTVEADAEQNRS